MGLADQRKVGSQNLIHHLKLELVVLCDLTDIQTFVPIFFNMIQHIGNIKGLFILKEITFW